MTLRKTFNNWAKCKEQATELAALINEKFTEEKLFAGFCEAVYGDSLDIISDDELDRLFEELQ